MAVFAGAFLCALVASHVPAGRVFGISWPIYVLVAFTVLFNMFVWNPDMDALEFTTAGLLRGCFFAVRILLLVWTCLILCFSATSTELVQVMNSFLSPLRKLGVPTDDIAMVFSIALRFLPIMAEEFNRVKNAQWARGAKFEGSLREKLAAYSAVLLPMFVGLFRRADSLAQAMDSRCYGISRSPRTYLNSRRISAASIGTTLIGCAALVVVATLL